MTFHSTNTNQSIPDTSKPFEVTCQPGTDIWDKPPDTHSWNAPFFYRTTTAGSFKYASVQVSSSWKDQYDQGGLCVSVRSPIDKRWVKAGIEFENGQPNVGIVAKDNWSDWSLLPLDTATATIEMEVSEDGSLWVYLYSFTRPRIPLREVTWWSTLPKDAELWVGVYSAKPAPQGQKTSLVVTFENLKITA